jgi:hypothetical protein
VNSPIATARLENQGIARSVARKPAQLVAWLGAVQAQEYSAALWALGLRLPASTLSRDVEAAFNRGQIVRTHVLRPTWHFVALRDADWLIALTAARVHRRMAPWHARLQLDSAIRVRAAGVIERALRDGEPRTRAELARHLERARLPSRGIPLALLTMYAELERVMHSGPFRGKQPTYVRYVAHAPAGRQLIGDEAIAELAKRYFRSHGPATIRDFTWWSTLTTRDAKRGLEANRAKQHVIDGLTYWTIGDALGPAARQRSTVHLLPVYDEYLVAYRDRAAVALGRGRSTGGRYDPTLIIGGQVAGTWKITRREGSVVIHVAPARRLSAAERFSIETAVDQYGKFLGLPATWSLKRS